ncbi:MAG: DedA family protein [Gemmatimonadaceae bacterium]|nr:DedA family protein [Gemmatimonadaceae bacterium]
MTPLLDWVNALDVNTLYALLGVVAFIESIFPPAPADVVVAFGAFYAARREAAFWPVVAAIVIGSVLGSLVVYAVARRYGADWMHARLKRLHLLNAEERLEGLYAHYGLAALFVSRFVPGLRAVVSPMAGALRVRVLPYALVITVASTIWYGLIIWVAFRVGADWEQVRSSLHVVGLRVGSVAAVLIVVLAYVGWRMWRRHRAKHPHLRHPPA